MKINQAELIISAVSAKQYPEGGLPEIALAGRSNVGKSSFINKMINRKALARTSSKPGKTQTLNFYQLNEAFFFVDVPGYGYAKVSKKKEKFGEKMMEEYFVTRESLKATVLLIDSRHEPTKDDQVMYDFLKHYEIPVIVVATKIDKLSKSKKAKHLKAVKDVLEMESEDHLVGFSAETAEGKEEAWRYVTSYIQ